MIGAASSRPASSSRATTSALAFAWSGSGSRAIALEERSRSTRPAEAWSKADSRIARQPTVSSPRARRRTLARDQIVRSESSPVVGDPRCQRTPRPRAPTRRSRSTPAEATDAWLEQPADLAGRGVRIEPVPRRRRDHRVGTTVGEPGPLGHGILGNQSRHIVHRGPHRRNRLDCSDEQPVRRQFAAEDSGAGTQIHDAGAGARLSWFISDVTAASGYAGRART